jgi:hypothetical protein
MVEWMFGLIKVHVKPRQHFNVKSSESSLKLSFGMYIFKWLRDKPSLVSVREGYYFPFREH